MVGKIPGVFLLVVAIGYYGFRRRWWRRAVKIEARVATVEEIASPGAGEASEAQAEYLTKAAYEYGGNHYTCRLKLRARHYRPGDGIELFVNPDNPGVARYAPEYGTLQGDAVVAVAIGLAGLLLLALF